MSDLHKLSREQLERNRAECYEGIQEALRLRDILDKLPPSKHVTETRKLTERAIMILGSWMVNAEAALAAEDKKSDQ